MSELIVHLLLGVAGEILGGLLEWLFANTVSAVVDFLFSTHKDYTPAEFYKIVLNKEKI